LNDARNRIPRNKARSLILPVGEVSGFFVFVDERRSAYGKMIDSIQSDSLSLFEFFEFFENAPRTNRGLAVNRKFFDIRLEAVCFHFSSSLEGTSMTLPAFRAIRERGAIPDELY
jgi:hypothetical protein